ncbi:unnamed protein product [Prorocentrum cordatum]|uniref:Uncharacterized protein n=1 Tax=Prorocentrum cordatum TaxID=2364126 RepID=A0ABN9SCH6_9DINO|nr:unnamed protein product [Polarella glacialis]
MSARPIHKHNHRLGRPPPKEPNSTVGPSQEWKGAAASTRTTPATTMAHVVGLKELNLKEEISGQVEPTGEKKISQPEDEDLQLMQTAVGPAGHTDRAPPTVFKPAHQREVQYQGLQHGAAQTDQPPVEAQEPASTKADTRGNATKRPAQRPTGKPQCKARRPAGPDASPDAQAATGSPAAREAMAAAAARREARLKEILSRSTRSHVDDSIELVQNELHVVADHAIVTKSPFIKNDRPGQSSASTCTRTVPSGRRDRLDELTTTIGLIGAEWVPREFLQNEELDEQQMWSNWCVPFVLQLMEAKDMNCLFNATDDDDHCDYKKQLAEEVCYTAWGRSASLREVLRAKIRERRQQGQELTDDQQRMARTFLRLSGTGSPESQPLVLHSSEGQHDESGGDGRVKIGSAEAVALLLAAAAARPSPREDEARSAGDDRPAAPRPPVEQVKICRDDWKHRLEEQINHATQPAAAAAAGADARGGAEQQTRAARRTRQRPGADEVQQAAKAVPKLVGVIAEHLGIETGSADQADLDSSLEKELTEFLENSRLSKYLDDALKWCDEQGAASIEDIVENPEDFVEAMGFKPLERKRFDKACALASE